MEHDAEATADHLVAPALDETGLLNLSSISTADLFQSGENVFAHSLRRLAADLVADSDAPLLAAFGNFAPSDEPPPL